MLKLLEDMHMTHKKYVCCCHALDEDGKKRILVHYGSDAMIFFYFFLDEYIDPAHHIYNIQLTENVF